MSAFYEACLLHTYFMENILKTKEALQMLMYVLKIQYFKQEYYIMKSYLYTRKLYYEHFTTAF